MCSLLKSLFSASKVFELSPGSFYDKDFRMILGGKTSTAHWKVLDDFERRTSLKSPLVSDVDSERISSRERRQVLASLIKVLPAVAFSLSLLFSQNLLGLSCEERIFVRSTLWFANGASLEANRLTWYLAHRKSTVFRERQSFDAQTLPRQVKRLSGYECYLHCSYAVEFAFMLAQPYLPFPGVSRSEISLFIDWSSYVARLSHDIIKRLVDLEPTASKMNRIIIDLAITEAENSASRAHGELLLALSMSENMPPRACFDSVTQIEKSAWETLESFERAYPHLLCYNCSEPFSLLRHLDCKELVELLRALTITISHVARRCKVQMGIWLSDSHQRDLCLRYLYSFAMTLAWEKKRKTLGPEGKNSTETDLVTWPR